MSRLPSRLSVPVNASPRPLAPESKQPLCLNNWPCLLAFVSQRSSLLAQLARCMATMGKGLFHPAAVAGSRVLQHHEHHD